jgi:hypothetical protein
MMTLKDKLENSSTVYRNLRHVLVVVLLLTGLAPLAINALADESLSSSSTKWTKSDGWHGIVPGKSNIKDAIAKYGTPTAKSESRNSRTYAFDGGAIEVTADKRSDTVWLILVNSTVKNDPDFPKDKIAAISRFNLKSYGEPETKLYGDGVKATFGEGPTPELRQLEFTQLTIMDSAEAPECSVNRK